MREPACRQPNVSGRTPPRSLGPTPESPGPLRPVVPRNACVLAFDFGVRWIGVAVGDTETRIAHPLTTIDALATRERFEQIAALVNEWQPGRLVVGLPLAVDGERIPTTDRADRFSRQLGGRFRLPVHRVDERYTSVAATSELATLGHGQQARRLLEHAYAARIILEGYFHDHAA